MADSTLMKKKNQPNISQAEENEFLDAMSEIKLELSTPLVPI